jgi:hypothetical protein
MNAYKRSPLALWMVYKKVQPNTIRVLPILILNEVYVTKVLFGVFPFNI